MQNLTISPLCVNAAQAAEQRLGSLAKLPGSLGKLETLVVRLAAMTGQERPSFARKSVVIFAADHDIVLNGLSCAPQAITAMQVRNFLNGGAAINAFARTAGADVVVVDVGIKDDFAPLPPDFEGDHALEENLSALIRRRVMPGARDFSKEQAMSHDEALACLQTGVDMARHEAARGIKLLAAGEMGIGNTSPSSAIAAVLTGVDVPTVTGTGSGIDDVAMRRKIACIEKAIALHFPAGKTAPTALDVLACVGGPEIGAMAGFMLGAASLRIPLVVDGFIAGAAAAIAVGINPAVKDYLIGSHLSAEPGHILLMKHIGVEPFFDFGLRLGEGTGAALMFPIIDSSVRILDEMRTLQDIGM